MYQDRRPQREIRAAYDDTSVTVYQAYPPRIADRAVSAGKFVAPFRRHRMTWIKPSFLWMMYRCGWATKPDQERVLAIRITREGFDEALRYGCLSTYDPSIHQTQAAWEQQKASSTIRIQWDPERDRNGHPLPWRSVQIGLSGHAVDAYLDSWTLAINDITGLVHTLHGDPDLSLPAERPYPASSDIRAHLGMNRDH